MSTFKSNVEIESWLEEMGLINSAYTINQDFSVDIKSLNISNHSLNLIPIKMGKINDLNLDHNQFTSLPTLPIQLESLSVSQNNLLALPLLPKNLTRLDCSANKLTTLPDLPNSLIFLKCDNQNLESLPLLPENLKSLSININHIKELPPLPQGLISLSCQNNPLDLTLFRLPLHLPNSLKELALPLSLSLKLSILPPSLQKMDISDLDVKSVNPSELISLFHLILSHPNLKQVIVHNLTKDLNITHATEVKKQDSIHVDKITLFNHEAIKAFFKPLVLKYEKEKIDLGKKCGIEIKKQKI